MPPPPNPGPRDCAPGTTFADGQLTVLRWEWRQEKEHRRTYCIVQCRCGVVFPATPHNLRHGYTTSCGCVYTAQRRARMAAVMRAWWANKKGAT